MWTPSQAIAISLNGEEIQIILAFRSGDDYVRTRMLTLAAGPESGEVFDNNREPNSNEIIQTSSVVLKSTVHQSTAVQMGTLSAPVGDFLNFPFELRVQIYYYALHNHYMESDHVEVYTVRGDSNRRPVSVHGSPVERDLYAPLGQVCRLISDEVR